MYEILRLIDALQTTTEYNVVTPANWMPGDPVIVFPPTTFDGLLERSNNNPEQSGLNCEQWYMCYKDV